MKVELKWEGDNRSEYGMKIIQIYSSTIESLEINKTNLNSNLEMINQIQTDESNRDLMKANICLSPEIFSPEQCRNWIKLN
jgi:hypothetical protein